MGTSSEQSIISKKKRKHKVTAAQLHFEMERIEADRVHLNNAYYAIIEKVQEQKVHRNGGNVSIAAIVKKVNKMYNTKWRADTIRKRIRNGTESTVPMKGRKPKLPKTLKKPSEMQFFPSSTSDATR